METEVEMCDREGVCLEGGSGGLICFYSFFFLLLSICKDTKRGDRLFRKKDVYSW